MKTQTGKHTKSREGGALLMVMLVLLIFSVLQIGLYKLRETSVVESVFVEHHKQAFWLAESGLGDALVLLNYDQDFRDNPTAVPTVNVSAVDGSYDINVVKTTINAMNEEYDYTVTSTGTVRGVSRVLQTVYNAYPGGKYAIIGIDGNTELAANVDVIGAIAQIQGTLDVKDSRGLDGYLIMGDGEGALTDKKGEALVLNYPPPPTPVIDYGGYEASITKVANEVASTGKTVNLTNSVLSGTLRYNDDVVVGGTGTTIADGTIIITTGSISFPKSHVTIGNNVNIVANNFSIANQSEIGGGSLIYSQNDIYLRNASDTTTSGGSSVVLLARGSIEFESQINFRGVIFADDEVHINANGTIEGTIIGGVGIEADANITITYDPTVFRAGTPITPKTFGDVILTKTSWRELPSL